MAGARRGRRLHGFVSAVLLWKSANRAGRHSPESAFSIVQRRSDRTLQRKPEHEADLARQRRRKRPARRTPEACKRFHDNGWRPPARAVSD
jgi:hypothetical protein